MKVIGVTGGIGSGKTTFCGFFKSQGFPVINADVLAKSLMVENATLKGKIISSFGSESYKGDGSLNRVYLSGKAFSENRVSELNALVHPVVKSTVQEIIKENSERGLPLLVYEAAILLNNGRPDFVDVVIWIEADVKTRIDRVIDRDKVDPQSVTERIDKQISIESVRDYVDIVVQNTGSLEELENVALKLIQEYVR